MKKLLLMALIGLSGNAQADSQTNSSPWGEIIGAFAGAYVGNRIGGDGLGTIIGAVAGSYAGGRIQDNMNRPDPRMHQQHQGGQPQVIYLYPPEGYHYETVVDSTCRCYRNILIAN